MKTKIAKKYSYDGLGFPIQLQDVTLVQLDGEWIPKIDVRKIAEDAIRELPLQKEKLSGNQVKFIRDFFEMSLRDFANEVVKQSHTAVAKWEKFAEKSTNMDSNIEDMLRLYILDKLVIKSMEKSSTFLKSYRLIREMAFIPKSPSVIYLKNQ